MYLHEVSSFGMLYLLHKTEVIALRTRIQNDAVRLDLPDGSDENAIQWSPTALELEETIATRCRKGKVCVKIHLIPLDLELQVNIQMVLSLVAEEMAEVIAIVDGVSFAKR
jgi:hypothetical protein